MERVAIGIGRDWRGRYIFELTSVCEQGGEEIQRTFKIRYRIPSPERRNAINFLVSHGCDLSRSVPEALWGYMNLSQRDVNKRMRELTFDEEFDLLHIPTLESLSPKTIMITGADLYRISFLTETRILKLLLPNVEDRQLSFLSSLSRLEVLILYSQSLTDQCAEVLSELPKTLKTLDLQCSFGISPQAAESIRCRLPWVSRFYPPNQLMKQPG